ncbi:MAG: hypothetical protein JW741_20410 [Sedimentisphaerales bacterium]|nr:hypothetical protein [Sedimentisphaerales bacterium]
MVANRDNSRGLTHIEVVVVTLVGAFLLVAVPVAGRKAQSDAARVRCAANLMQIGKAMLVYANDYDGALPRAGGRSTCWGVVRNWRAGDRYDAFGIARSDNTGGTATISSCFYLLVRYAGMAPAEFVCPDDAGTTAFELAEVPDLPADFELTDAWDFGPEAYRHCSYAYHMPFGLYALTTAHHDPCMAVAADRNPWLRSPAAKGETMGRFMPDIPPWHGTAEQAREGNTLSHGQEGQNVLFLDGHVAFEERAYCSLNDDNIYTISNNMDTGDSFGTAPPASHFDPSNRHDSVLVHDPAPQKPTIRTAEPQRVDTRDLAQTAVVATLDCPLSPHKNVVWCGTFQMAWDKLREDIIGEPIQLHDEPNMAARLNAAPFPPDALEAESFYTTAGLIKDGVIEQIHRDMARQFPGELQPIFGKRYNEFPGPTIISYAYLNVDVGFAHPFYVNNQAFRFQDSNAVRTNVASFRALNESPSANVAAVREQVENLYYRSGENRNTAESAVDLCKHTQPYQVVLARAPRGNTLRATLADVEREIAAFRDRAEYEALRKLRPIDRLTVPDVLYELTHDFVELLDKFLVNGNPGGVDYFIVEARQKIDFALSRTGVILKSEARIVMPPARRDDPVDKPRYFTFDRPFLIYVRKRQPDAKPFFVMWVDNAELMQRYDTPTRSGSSHP